MTRREIKEKTEKGTTWATKRAAKRASESLRARAKIDADNYERKSVFEGSLASAAQYAANSIRCVDSLLLEFEIQPRDLVNARKMLLSAINLLVNAGIPRKRG